MKLGRKLIYWLPTVNYILHNFFVFLTLRNGTSLTAGYLQERYNLSPIWLMILLTDGLIWVSCFWLPWRFRVAGMLPLVFFGIMSLWIYSEVFALHRIVSIGWVYLTIVVYPFALIVAIGDNQDRRIEEAILRREAHRLEELVKLQETKLIAYESRFEVGRVENGAK